MNNFPIQHEDKTYWIARNMAVTCFVFTLIANEWCVLANKRGDGVPDFKGCWNAPCGYLDYNETTAKAAMREVYEETGVRLSQVKLWNFNDSPEENLQNVTFRYYSIIKDPQWTSLNGSSYNRGGENNEVAKVEWIPLTALENYKWAFKHDRLIEELAIELCLL